MNASRRRFLYLPLLLLPAAAPPPQQQELPPLQEQVRLLEDAVASLQQQVRELKQVQVGQEAALSFSHRRHRAIENYLRRCVPCGAPHPEAKGKV